MLAYGMNDLPLDDGHGAPLRLRNEVQLGFNQVKWIKSIEFVENFSDVGGGYGGYNRDHGVLRVPSEHLTDPCDPPSPASGRQHLGGSDGRCHHLGCVTVVDPGDTGACPLAQPTLRCHHRTV